MFTLNWHQIGRATLSYRAQYLFAAGPENHFGALIFPANLDP